MRFLGIALGLLLAGAVAGAAAAPATVNPASDLAAFHRYFQQRFPRLALADYLNGPYNFNASERSQWKEIMQFPPYAFALQEGHELFDKKFPDGKSYGDCFPHGGIGIAADYPKFDARTGRVVTLGILINQCRAGNGLPKLSLTKGAMAAIESYMTDTSRGKPIAVTIPDDPRALAAYEAGKKYFYSRHGQLNFSCASCHMQSAGMRLRGDTLAPALGLAAIFPIYRSKWGDMGTLVRRFISCDEKVGAAPAKPDSDRYRNLAYFLTYMSNGVPLGGPAARP
ncbi:MAG: sulfur oxidation c-type cytochrome SoxA [Acetobacteraceae bacterium]